ncbi:MAG: terpene synthase family protein, partial [Actinocrinis sp.]
AGRVGPHATTEGLLLNADWQTWLFLFDDAFCDESDIGRRPTDTVELAGRVLRVVEGAQVSARDPNPFLPALADLRERLRRMATPAQFDRFAGQTVYYLLALTWEAAHRERRTLAELDEYVEMRRYSGAVYPCLALIDVINGFELPSELWSSPRLREVNEAAADIICWGNDIMSYPREIRRSTHVLSLPAVLVQADKLTIDEALREAADRHDQRVRDFQRMQAPLLEQGDERVARYLSDIRSWISGHLAWSAETRRYELGIAA